MARNDPSTPASDRQRIAALEEQITRLEKVVDRQQGDLDIQLQRIAQLQADLDAVRSAWATVKPRKRSS
jgi:uncharacterized coiled-coil protein SlyX